MANRSSRSARADVYTRITDEIVAAIEKGAGDWRMPWHHDGSSIARPRNVASDKAYRGINILALWVAATRSGYTGGTWGTYRQWAERGCQVRRGETATTVVFWKQIGRRDNWRGGDDDADGLDQDERPRAPTLLRARLLRLQRGTGGRALTSAGAAAPAGVRAHRPCRRLLCGAQDSRSSSRATRPAIAPTSIRSSCRRSSASSTRPASIPVWATNAVTPQVHPPGSTAISPAASARQSTPWTKSVALSGQSGRGLSGQSPATRPSADADVEATLSRC